MIKKLALLSLLLVFLFSCDKDSAHLYSEQPSLSVHASDSLDLSLNNNSSCPSSSEDAKKDLEKYLSDSNTINDLVDRYNLSITKYSHEEIDVVTSSEKCDNLIENSPWLENVEQYSFYKTDSVYFVVAYSFIEDDKYERKSISIYNSNFERVAVTINWPDLK